MKRPQLLLFHFAIGLICSVAVARGSVLDGPIVDPSNGHSYYLLSQNNWSSSETEALTLGGNLATVRNQGENDWIFNTFADYGGVARCLWIGLTDEGHKATYSWISGEPVSFTFWETGQPDNGAGGPPEDYAQLLPPGHYAAGYWNDFQDLSVVSFPDVPLYNIPVDGVVEVVPEPLTSGILMTGGVVLFGRLRRAARRG